MSDRPTDGVGTKRSGNPRSSTPELSAEDVSNRYPVPIGRPHISLRGLGAAPGIAIGVVRLHTYARIAVRERDIPENQIEEEIDSFRRAIDKSREEVAFLRDRVAEELGEESARIFDAQLLFFEDVMVIDGTVRDIRAERRNAAAVFRRNVNRMIQRLSDADTEYLRERAEDFQDAKRRVLRHILEISHSADSSLEPNAVLVARDLAPSEAASLNIDRIRGLVTQGGTLTSHAAIMSRTKGIPAVVGVAGIVSYVKNGDIIAVDGTSGMVEINPPPPALIDFQRRLHEYRVHEDDLAGLRGEEAITADGHRIELAANIESPADVTRVIERGANGVGLYRTEFFYIERARMPSEDEQSAAYTEVADKLKPRTVIIRTMDVGGDKVASYLGIGRETNPFLGWRGIRYSLERQDVFRTQLRAIFRASRHGNVRIMLPMISSVDELRAARAIVDEVRAELVHRVPAAAGVAVGIMIETPAAVMMADMLARESDFFSVGSNDLIQYTLAVDRTNPKIAHLYEPLHPAIVRGLKTVVDAAKAQGIWVGICGEMAADPLAAVLLVGLGFDELSVTPYLVPEVKEVVRAVSYEEARALVDEALRQETGAAIREQLRTLVGKRLSRFLLA